MGVTLGILQINFISSVSETCFDRWSFFNFLSTESLSSVRLDQANLLFFEIIDGVVVLQELGTKDPVFLTLLASETREVPRGHE